jgi:hypothetical protein
MHAVIRRYRVRLGTMEQAAHYAEKWFVPLVREIPGFRAHYLMAEERDLASLGLFETAEAAVAANKLAAQWFQGEWGAFRPLPPEVISAEVLTHDVANRRVLADRRVVHDRRSGAALIQSESEQRSGGDRRRGDRRAPGEAPLEWRAAG